MSLEEVIERNTKAIEAHTAAILGKSSEGGGSAAAGTPNKGGRPRKVTFEQVKAIAERVKNEKSREDAVALINKHGAASLGEMKEDKYAAFVAAAEVVLSTTEEQEANDEL